MSARRFIGVLILIIVVGVIAGVVTFAIIGQSGDNPLVAGHRYHILTLRSNTFFDDNGNRIGLATEDTSFGMFNHNFTRFDVHFSQRTFTFVVSSTSQRRGVFTAELRGILNGYVRTLYLSSSNGNILIHKYMPYHVDIDEADDEGYEREFRRLDLVLSFTFNPPAFMGIGGGDE
ncbi:MAG: hypothetical protein FWE38_01575 [Firmicutes bacterium]|nr:hypothetical protein [Bacillota bacterium]